MQKMKRIYEQSEQVRRKGWLVVVGKGSSWVRQAYHSSVLGASALLATETSARQLKTFSDLCIVVERTGCGHVVIVRQQIDRELARYIICR